MADEQKKLTNLFSNLWRDAEDEARSLRTLLRGAHEDVCSLTCRSHFPAGHVHSDADHSAKCRAITAALSDADADAKDRVAVGDTLPRDSGSGKENTSADGDEYE